MISYIKGKLALKLENSIVIENQGIGYEVMVPLSSPVYMTKEGENVICHTYMAVREDDISLYGFADRKTLKMFELLLTVNGIGAKAAMSILSTLDIERLSEAIATEDDKAISMAPGVGKKTAQRLVLELKDKIFYEASASGREDNDSEKPLKDEAVNALMALGYTRAESLTALSGIEASDVEGYIKKALKNLI